MAPEPVPTPLSGALCWELARPLELVIVSSAVWAPAANGVKKTWMGQEAPPAKVAGGCGQEESVKEYSAAFGPVREILVKLTGVEPGLVTVIVCPRLVVPMIWVLKIRLEGLSVSAVACEAGGGLAITIPNGVVSAKVEATVFEDVWMVDTVLPTVLAT